jgi:xylan 1,4-beta-xylosidase
MLGNADSGGVWAPCLSHANGLYYLVYSNVRRWKEEPYKIVDNYLVTAESVDGRWSDPIYLNSSGFDASLFHDDDGRKWLLSMEWDHRNKAEFSERFSGILLQEYSPASQSLVGDVKKIFKGTNIGMVEGPHLYRANGYYYLLTAEGGTEYNHAVSIARSRELYGPYEIHPENPLLTSASKPHLELQKAGHGSLVVTEGGEWYLAHLCSRPVDGEHCILGRETALQKCLWREDDWLYLESGEASPSVEVSGPEGLECKQIRSVDWDGYFAEGKLDIHFQSLRRPMTEDWITLNERPGWLRLRGGEPTMSTFSQSLLARRVQSFRSEASTEMDFSPDSFKQMAGLIAYYDTQNHYYLRVSANETAQRGLNIIETNAGVSGEVFEEDLQLPVFGTVHLKVLLNRADLRFFFSTDGEDWSQIGPVLDARVLSDDYHDLGFTGAFFGICAQDEVSKSKHADFRYFIYREFPEQTTN